MATQKCVPNGIWDNSEDEEVAQKYLPKVLSPKPPASEPTPLWAEGEMSGPVVGKLDHKTADPDGSVNRGTYHRWKDNRNLEKDSSFCGRWLRFLWAERGEYKKKYIRTNDFNRFKGRAAWRY